MSKSILLLGKPHSSKTVFLSQLYTRLTKNKSKLKLYKPAEDFSFIAEARASLAAGKEPDTTPAEKSVKFYLPIQVGQEQVDLKCPEYGGEQILEIVESREINTDWKTSINESNHWILFVRLNNINKSLDLSDVTYSEDIASNASENHLLESNQLLTSQLYTISDQSFLIELLQIILHAKGTDYLIKNRDVKLSIVLTCWDEMGIGANATPYKVLKEKLPLLLSFAESNWASESFKVLGLSAQEFSLETKENQEKYEYEGPENFGFIICEDGTKSNDITELIELALK